MYPDLIYSKTCYGWLYVGLFKFAVWFDMQAFLFYDHCRKNFKHRQWFIWEVVHSRSYCRNDLFTSRNIGFENFDSWRKKERQTLALLAQVCGIVWSQPYHSASPSALACSPARFCASLSCKLRLQRPNQRLRPVVYLGPDMGFYLCVDLWDWSKLFHRCCIFFPSPPIPIVVSALVSFARCFVIYPHLVRSLMNVLLQLHGWSENLKKVHLAYIVTPARFLLRRRWVWVFSSFSLSRHSLQSHDVSKSARMSHRKCANTCVGLPPHYFAVQFLQVLLTYTIIYIM